MREKKNEQEKVALGAVPIRQTGAGGITERAMGQGEDPEAADPEAAAGDR